MKNSTIQLRVSLEHKARIKTVADYQDISVTGYIIKLIDSDLKDYQAILQNKTQIDMEGLK